MNSLFDAGGDAAANPHSQSLYRKWRSQTFAELVGQEHVTRALRNAVASGRVGHAYLFAGPRGTGKTSSARLLAKALNCTFENAAERPCGVCEVCVSIAKGRAIDLIEIDAASNRGIDEIRELRERVNYAPAQFRFKFYIIDEVHMLTEAAFNALLKTLEEPPPHAVFVLATTDPQDIPPTVVSRCQQFQFRRIDLETIIDWLSHVCEEEGLLCERGALELIARSATGSMRDALSLLDQLIVTTGASRGGSTTLSTNDARAMLGMRGAEAVGRFVAAVLAADLPAGLDEIHGLVQSGTDIKRFNRDLVDQLRYIYLLKASPRAADLADIPDAQRDELTQQAARIDLPRIMGLLKIFSSVDYGMKVAPYAQLPLEIALLEAVIADAAPQQPAPFAPVAATPRPAAARPATTPSPMENAPRPDTTPHAPVGGAPRPDSAAEDTRKPARGYTPPAPPPRDEPPPLFDAPVVEIDVTIVADVKADITTTIDLDVVRAGWPKVLEKIRTTNATIGAVLRDAAPVSLEESLVTLSFPYEFHYNKIREERNRVFVEQTLYAVVGAKLGVRCVYTPNEPPPTADRAGRWGDRFK